MPEVQKLRLADIDLKNSYQPRVKGLDKDHVADLKAAYEAKQEIARPVAWRMADGSYRLAEGFHRYEGAMQAGIKSLYFTVLSGTESEYRIHAACSNQGHGLKRTNADKRRSVEVLLKELPNYSDRKIAEMAGVSDPFVGELRRQVLTVSTSSDEETRSQVLTVSTSNTRTGRDGKQYPESQPVQNKQLEDNSASTDADSLSPRKGEPEQVNQPEPAATDSGTDEQEGLPFIKQVEAVCREFDQIKARIESWKEHQEAYAIHFPTIIGGIERLRQDLWGCRLSHDCPYCAKNAKPDCKACRGTNKVIKAVHTQGERAMNKYGGAA